MTDTTPTTNTITYTEHQWIWRVQGDIQNGDISTLTLQAFWNTVWVDSNNNVINTIPGGIINLNTAESGIQDQFAAIQVKLNSQILSI